MHALGPSTMRPERLAAAGPAVARSATRDRRQMNPAPFHRLTVVRKFLLVVLVLVPLPSRALAAAVASNTGLIGVAQEYVEQFRTGDALERDAAAQALVQLGPEVAPVVLPALQSSDVSVRAVAAGVL